jgi:hypothetical protein
MKISYMKGFGIREMKTSYNKNKKKNSALGT